MTANLLTASLLLMTFSQMLANMLLELRVKSTTFLIWPILALFIVIPILAQLLSEQNGPSDLITINHALAIVIIFNFFYALGFSASTTLYNKEVLAAEQRFGSGWVPMLPYLISGFIFFIFIAQGFNVSRVLQSTWKDKQELGFFAVVILWLVCALGGLSCYAISEKRIKSLLVILATSLIVLIFYRTRAIVSIFVVSYLLYLIIVRGKSIRILVTLGAFGLLVAIAVRALRFLGALSNVTDIAHLTDIFLQIVKTTFTSGDLSIYRVYLRIINDCHSYLDCFNFTIVDQIFSFTGVTEKSSLRIEYDLYSQMIESGMGGSLHPTIYGLIYADMGLWFGLVFFLLVGCFNFAIGQFSKGWRFYSMVGFLAPYIIFLPRGSFYNSVSLVFVGIIYTLIVGVIRKSGTKRHGIYST